MRPDEWTDKRVLEWANRLDGLRLTRESPALKAFEVVQDLWKHRFDDDMTEEDRQIVSRALTLLGVTVSDDGLVVREQDAQAENLTEAA